MVHSHICSQCGREYKSPWQNQKFCSYECRGLSERIRPVSCICQYCGKEFEPKTTSRLTYCSRECYFRKIRDEKHVRKWLKTEHRYQKVSLKPIKPTDEERKAKERERSRQYELKKFIPKTFVCKECGETFQTEYGNKKRCYCSPACTEMAKKRWRRNGNKDKQNHCHRARYFGVEYEPIKRSEILARDNWICGLCGKRIDKKSRFPDPGSPSLDHIIPMSLGGPHLKHNVQAAHFICNSRKREKAMGEQLLLMG